MVLNDQSYKVIATNNKTNAVKTCGTSVYIYTRNIEVYQIIYCLKFIIKSKNLPQAFVISLFSIKYLGEQFAHLSR